jgi:hypothetical protein
MNAPHRLHELSSEISKTLMLLRKNREFYLQFRAHDLPKLGKSTAAAMVLSQVFMDFYTCVETLLWRISQCFENQLETTRWHKSLLQKMTLDISEVRPAVISDHTFSVLLELLHFRHFRRYYYDMDYDWDRLEFVEKKYLDAMEGIQQDLPRFDEFINAVKD